jgi:hypothetical protein
MDQMQAAANEGSLSKSSHLTDHLQQTTTTTIMTISNANASVTTEQNGAQTTVVSLPLHNSCGRGTAHADTELHGAPTN